MDILRSCSPPPSHLLFHFFFLYPCAHRHLHSFPTRRSSDLSIWKSSGVGCGRSSTGTARPEPAACPDRKSTRLNSSHLVISYAVFCLKKKNIQIKISTSHSIHSTFCIRLKFLTI